MLTYLMIFAGVVLVLAIGAYIYFDNVKKKFAKAKEEDHKRRQERLENLPTIPLSERDELGIYQWSFHHGERHVARAVGPEVDESGKRVSFREITHSDLLLLPDECHFRKYKIEIDSVGDALREDKTEPDKGRILRDVTAHITGYVEQ